MEKATKIEKEPKNEKQLQERTQRRIICPVCGNDREFLEVADGVILTTRYLQNDDHSFTQDGDESQILGEIKFYCGECNSDLSQYHQRFLELLF